MLIVKLTSKEEKYKLLMTQENIRLEVNQSFNRDEVLEIYTSNHWSSAQKPELLINALKNAHTLILAYLGEQMVGVAYAISDGFLVVYYPHMLVHPEFQGLGIGTLIMEKFTEIYKDFHMQMLTADGKAVEFYAKHGFRRAGDTVSMWKYDGEEH